MKALDDLMKSIVDMGEEDRAAPGRLDLLLYAPCPVKLAVKERIDAVAGDAAGRPLAIHIPMGCTSVDPYDPLYQETDPERLPGIIASIGFGDFFRKGFVERFADAGLFEAVLPDAVHPMLADLVDPKGRYVVYGLTPYVFMIDSQRLGDVPPPKRWADLLDPRYRGQINMCGDGDDMADAVLISVFKDHGMEGIKRFAANTRGLMHSSRMAKSGGAPNAGGVYILPYFFAETSKQPAHMRMIWPEDGAAASPLYFLAKRSERERLGGLIDFFRRGFGEIESARWFLPLGGPMPESLPEGARVKWPGWDFIDGNDVTGLRDELNAAFGRFVREAACA